MSRAPDSLKAIRHMVAEKTAGRWKTSIGARFPKPPNKYEGYHAGYGDIDGPYGVGTANAYSTRRVRDRKRRNLSHVPPLAGPNSSSASDISARGEYGANRRLQREFTAWCVAEAKAGRLDVQFIVGPDANGAPTIWVKPDWKPKPGVDRDHTHLSWPRDTEFGDRVSQLLPYFETVYKPGDAN